MNYFDLLAEKCKVQRDSLFVVINNQPYTYGKMVEDAQVLGEEIAIQRQVILILSKDLAFQLTAFFAVMQSGNVPVIAHFDLPQAALFKLMMKNQLRYLLTDMAQDETVYQPLQVMKTSRLYEIAQIEAKIVESRVCMGALSSGSTDVPKVLLRTVESWTKFFPVQNEIFKVHGESKVFIEGSLSFTGNLNVVMAALYEGATVVVTDIFNCKVWVQMIETFDVTSIYLVPAKLKVLSKFIKQPLQTVEMIFTGSQLLFEQVAIKLKEQFPKSDIILYYGASELNYITYICYEDLLQSPMSVGRPFPGVQVTIKDGVIYVDTPYGVEGTTTPCSVQDMGYFDESQQLIFLGRKQHMINKGGFKVSCTKVENEIKKVVDVKNVVVIPYDDVKKGSEIAAFLVVDENIDRHKLREAIKKQLMLAEIPKKMIFVDEIPLNSLGKIHMEQLKMLL